MSTPTILCIGKMTQDDALGKIGEVSIWSSLIILPVIIIVLVVAAVLVARSKSSPATRSTAHWMSTQTPCPKPTVSNGSEYTCDAQVSVDGLAGSFQLPIPWDDANGAGLTTKSSWPVSYNLGNAKGTLRVVSASNNPLPKSTVVWILAGIAALLAIGWVIDLVFRNNSSFREFAGAGEVANLAAGVFSNSAG